MATKRLARQLGLARSRVRARSSTRAARQRFGYLIVIDFEATCWRDAGRRAPEIGECGRGGAGGRSERPLARLTGQPPSTARDWGVNGSNLPVEFPAVLLNTSTGEIESEFHTYVQPQEHPVLSEFCTELTGITQNQVDEGVPLSICLSQFLKWIQKIKMEKKIVFGTDILSNSTSEAKPCTFVTWTDWDLGVCLHYECKRKQLRKPDILNSWIDLKATYRVFYNRKPKGLNGALQDLGIAFTGREHSGLDDSRNTACLAWRLICDGCVLKVTKSLDKARLKNNFISRTLTINSTDKSPLGSKSRPEASRDGICETNSLAEKNRNSIAGIKINSTVQTEEQQTTCIDSSAAVLFVPTSNSRPELPAQSQSSSAVCTDRFPVPLEQAQQNPSTVSTGIPQGLNNGQPLSTARYSLPEYGSGLVLVSTTISSINISNEDTSTSSDCLSLLTDWEDVALIPESQYEQNSDCVQFEDDSSTDLLPVSEERVILKPSAVMSSANQSLQKTEVPVGPLKSVIYKSPDTTVNNVGAVQRQTSDFSACKLPSARVNTISSQSAVTGSYSTPSEVPKRKPTSPKMFPPAKKVSFAIYQEKTASFDHSLPLRCSNLSEVSPAILNSTVNLNQSVRAVKNGKPTPPLCKCGRRAKKRYVSNAGPNHGKAFFCCPVGKHEGSKKGCGYFKWEYALLKEKSNGPAWNADALTSLRSVANNSENSSNKKRLCLRPSMRT
ncbi:ERI1 exoribonuclease 2 [Pezoporus wallicus]|uniref:ERI1 exoribonuclease 2 n=1 Tax=Pezoporus wallicus TaxID=35540 RepID=UPI00254F9B1B|nr:ERI1 exoribonuclease 2 [Pezoporus wallicus]